MRNVKVDLALSEDGPLTMQFADIYAGLKRPWYHFDVRPKGDIELWANREGFEHLGRLFLKLARTKKDPTFHLHLPLEHRHGEAQILEGEPEFRIGFDDAPGAGTA